MARNNHQRASVSTSINNFLYFFCMFYLWRGIACPLDELSLWQYTICENHTTVHGLLIHTLQRPGSPYCDRHELWHAFLLYYIWQEPRNIDHAYDSHPIPDADVKDRETGVQGRKARRHSRVSLVPYSRDAEEQQECAHYLEYFRRHLQILAGDI